MSMRVTEMMRFNTMRTHLDSVQTRYAEILEKMASQRTINKISDDPSGVAMIMNYKKSQSSLSGYQQAIENAEAWITMTESQLTAADDILVKAREIALSQGTGTATEETRLYAAEQVSQLIDHLQSIANSQYADRYLFSGTKTGTKPFSAVPSDEPWLGDPAQAADNEFEGEIAVSGTYSGDENRTYAVRIVSDDGSGNYTWAVSDDGGRSWGPESAPEVLGAGSTITIDAGEGIDLEFSSVAEEPGEGDVFYVDAFAAGYYQGNADELSVEITKGVTFE
ncbi:MAG TPA: flagellar hook-associated protein 3, partial [Deltaproteobacteria bacterium]|nr:flagellar hook-associated protein 3 [Deltaproteobacteria bacterium]